MCSRHCEETDLPGKFGSWSATLAHLSPQSRSSCPSTSPWGFQPVWGFFRELQFKGKENKMKWNVTSEQPEGAGHLVQSLEAWAFLTFHLGQSRDAASHGGACHWHPWPYYLVVPLPCVDCSNIMEIYCMSCSLCAGKPPAPEPGLCDQGLQ